ncbi:MAG: DUF4160 domain-containing protein [Candidatus Eisenbacteria bacterium]
MDAPEGASGPEGSSPEVSRFFGIVVAMFCRDHWPPHFHVRYGNAQAVVAIESLSVLGGLLPA